jgi:hypothetical protein
VVVALLAVGTSAGPAAALDEAQITDVTCAGLHVTQRGLPDHLDVEVVVIETASGRTLKTVDAKTGADGLLDLRVAVALRGVRQIVVEVESGHTEYGEAGADLPQPCSRTPAQPVTARPVPSTSPVASPRMIGPVPPGAPVGAPAASPSPSSRRAPMADDGGLGPGTVIAIVGGLGLLLAAVGFLASRGRR